MIATVHALVGGAIAVGTNNPIVSPLLALTSHFILDSVPHWDFGTSVDKRSKQITGIIAIADTVVGMTISYILFQGQVNQLTLISCLIATQLPDWIEAPWYIFYADLKTKALAKNAGMIEKTLYHIYKIQNTFHTKTTFGIGVMTQIIAVIFFFILMRIIKI